MNTEKVAREIVCAVLGDLQDRSGIGDELDMIDEVIFGEMEDELIQLVEGILRARGVE